MSNYSLSIKIIVLLVISSQCRSILATENPCYCYTFHTNKQSWLSSNKHCQQNGGNLVTLETEEEYQFINKTIQSINDGKTEWFIGLTNNTGVWKWISNHSLTIDKWQPHEPSGDGTCVVMAKNYPAGRYGLFNDLKCNLPKMFICEYKTEICNRTNDFILWCPGNTSSKVGSTSTSTTETGTRHESRSPSTMSQKLPSTTTAKPTSLSETSTKQKPLTTTTTNPESPSTHEGSYWPKTTNQKPSLFPDEKDESPNSGQRKKETKPFMVIVAVALGVVLLLSVCFLVFACYWKRRNRDSKCEKKNQETNEMLTEVGHPTTSDQGSENTDRTEVVQLFHPKNGESYVTYAVIHNNLTQQNQGSANSNETATYASVEETKMVRSNSKKKDPYTSMPVAGSTEGGGKGNTEVVYASVDKKKSKIATQGTSTKTKANNEQNETQDDKQWSEGQQVEYASVDKSKKNKLGTDDVLYAEVENYKVNMDKQQPFQITYAELADLKHNAQEAAAVKPVPYQSVEYAVIIGQKM